MVITHLSYCHNYKHVLGTISDAFDGRHARNCTLGRSWLTAKELLHHYFSGKNDNALGFSTDSYLLFDCCRKGPSGTLITGGSQPGI
jgi:hypothetical protein